MLQKKKHLQWEPFSLLMDQLPLSFCLKQVFFPEKDILAAKTDQTPQQTKALFKDHDQHMAARGLR